MIVETRSGALCAPRAQRSFVLRQGRITPAQERAFSEHWPRYGLEFIGAVRDFDAVFGRHSARVIEIGFGNGEALHASALKDPTRDFIGIEVHRPGVGRVLNAAACDELGNLRVYRHDAVEVLRLEIAPASISELRVWFPDPWPKARHHKRRLINPEFAALAASRLVPGGVLHLATDWQDYAGQMRDVLQGEPLLESRSTTPGGFADNQGARASTHFERRGQRLGHGVWDLVATRFADSAT
ncbi:MAG: tRNA (guanosine(46)-N7)-methyltransferase TrmB [Lysobacterales bacterium]